MSESRDPRPPRVAQALLRRCLPAGDRDWVLGDLAEEFRNHRVPDTGPLRARLWYWLQVIRSVRHGLGRRARRRRERIPLRKDLMVDLLQDARYGARSLLRSPVFAGVTILTLALAIGVNTAIFTLANLLLFPPVPMQEIERIGVLNSRNPQRSDALQPVSMPDYLAFREATDGFAGLAAVRADTAVLTGADEPERLDVREVTHDLFEVWGVEPHLGRAFVAGEDRPGAEPVVVLAHGLWERQFGADPDVLGRAVELDGRAATIVGVADPELEFGTLSSIDLWRPLEVRTDRSRELRDLAVQGRLAEGVSVQEVRAELEAVAASLAAEYPDTNSGWHVVLRTYDDAVAGDTSAWTILTMLVVTVGLVLLLACFNVATVMLARAGGRAREMALRASLGARRWRLVRQLLVESVILAAVAGLFGVLVARGLLAGMTWMAEGSVPAFAMLEIDGSALVFTAAVSLAAPLLFGLFPAVRASDADLAGVLKESGGRPGAVGHGRGRARNVLVVAQIAVTLMLMVVAGVMMRSAAAVYEIDLGYDGDGVVTAELRLSGSEYGEPEAWRQFYGQVGERLRSMPEVVDAAWISLRPMSAQTPTRSFQIEGHPLPDPQSAPWTGILVASPGYHEVMEIPLLRGRHLRPEDDAEAPPVALVSATMVERYFPGKDPLGQRIRLAGGAEGEPLEIVGVVGDVAEADWESRRAPQTYLAMAQFPRPAMSVIARAAAGTEDAAGALRRATWEVDPGQAVSDVRTMERILRDDSAALRVIALLFAVFALLALVMAAAGVFGVTSYAVSSRTHEIGIRMALGARKASVLGRVLGRGARLVALGVALGIPGALLLSRLMAAMVVGVSPTDPLVYVGVPVVLAAVALLSSWLPARRAVRVDPLVALRAE